MRPQYDATYPKHYYSPRTIKTLCPSPRPSPLPSPAPSPRHSRIFFTSSSNLLDSVSEHSVPGTPSRPPSPSTTSNEHAIPFNMGASPKPQDCNNPNSAVFLTWRRLQLSRAKLKAINKTSALMSGFAMVAMVELQVNDGTLIPEGLFIAFAVNTSLLVAVHMIALMISTCILPKIEAVCNLHSMQVIDESPHETMHWYIEASWACSTVFGIFLFLLELVLLCWVKFYDFSLIASWAATVIIFPVLILFIAFAIHFYQKIIAHKYEITETGVRELEQMKVQLDQNIL